MTRTRRGRLTRREEIARRNASHRYYAISAGKPELADKFCRPLPKERATPKPSGKPLERNVLKEVSRALRADPRVSRVDRNTSGMFQDGDRFIYVGGKGKLDLTVYLVGGRYIEIEVKRDARTYPKEHQLKRIRDIKAAGGLAGWCWDAQSALALLP